MENPTYKIIVAIKPGTVFPGGPSTKFLAYSNGQLFYEMSVQDAAKIKKPKAQKAQKATPKPLKYFPHFTGPNLEIYDQQCALIDTQGPVEEHGYYKLVEYIYHPKTSGDWTKIQKMDVITLAFYRKLRSEGHRHDRIIDKIGGIYNSTKKYTSLPLALQNWLKYD